MAFFYRVKKVPPCGDLDGDMDPFGSMLVVQLFNRYGKRQLLRHLRACLSGTWIPDQRQTRAPTHWHYSVFPLHSISVAYSLLFSKLLRKQLLLPCFADT